MNLLFDPWIPIATKSGHRKLIAPLDIVDVSDPHTRIASPRPDFDDALLQFLIALVQTAMPPESPGQWKNRFTSPPSTDELQEALTPIAHAFVFDGGEISAFEDFDSLDSVATATPVGALLIDEPGGNAVKNGTDFFVKRERISRLCMPCAAAGLWTLQTMAPSGGAGNRTGVRGGGPLTVTVFPQDQQSLWATVWANVQKPHRERQDISPFPWTRHTRTSESNGGVCTLENSHPLEVYWGMPRRIRLNRDGGTGRCDLCGKSHEVTTTGYRAKNYGANYDSSLWPHPLSPYSKDKSGQWLPKHPQPGGFCYKHWLSMCYQTGNGTQRPAESVSRAMNERDFSGQEFGIRASGWDMDNMKPRCWYEAEFPVWQIPESVDREEYLITLQQWIDCADGAAQLLRQQLRKSADGDKVDVSWISSYADRFWDQTNDTFFRLARQLDDDNDEALSREWLGYVNRAAIGLYDEAVGFEMLYEHSRPGEVVKYRKELRRFLYSKKRQLGAGIPVAKRTDEASTT